MKVELKVPGQVLYIKPGSIVKTIARKPKLVSAKPVKVPNDRRQFDKDKEDEINRLNGHFAECAREISSLSNKIDSFLNNANLEAVHGHRMAERKLHTIIGESRKFLDILHRNIPRVSDIDEYMVIESVRRRTK